MARRKSRKSHKKSTFKRGFRSIFAIIVLTALVLGISYVIRGIATLDAGKVVDVSEPYLSMLGIDDEKVGQVAGDFAQRVAQTDLVPQAGNSENKVAGESNIMSKPVHKSTRTTFKFLP
jgi:hypothetical protein